MASEEELAVAAASTREGMTIQEHRTKMQGNMWGDSLMIALLSRAFGVDVAVITKEAARTWRADGSELAGACPNAH